MTSDSFVDFLQSYGNTHPPSMAYREGDDFSQWQARFREAVYALRGPLPKRVEPEPHIVSTTEESDHTRHLLRIPVSAVSDLPAHLLVPKGVAAGERRPGLVVVHGHESDIDAICGVADTDDEDLIRRAYARRAVEAGYVVLAIPLWGWVSRDGHLDLIGRRDQCNVIQMAAGMYGLSPMDLLIQDGQAAVDVLCARPDVDPRRIGCIGNSTGGRTTMWLAVFDERIAACVPSGCMNTFRERSLKLSSCGIQYLPGLLQYGDVPELFSLIAPRPMQLQAGEGDGLITEEDRDAMESTVRNAYRCLHAEDSLDYVLHPDGHLLRWDLAQPFLDRHLSVS